MSASAPDIAVHPERADEAAGVLKALAHPLRMRICAYLACKGEMCVGELAVRLGVPQPIVSQQLRILRGHALVGVSRREGHAFYRVTDPLVERLLRCMEGCSHGRAKE